MVAKMIEVLFVINPGIQSRTEQLHARVMAHPISELHLPSCLMKFYTGQKRQKSRVMHDVEGDIKVGENISSQACFSPQHF